MLGHGNEIDIERLEYLRNRIEQEPADVSALVGLGAMMFEPFHQPEEAIQLLKRSLELDPNNVDARFWLAKCLFHDYADYEAAKPILEEALQINPNRSDCLSLLASVITDLGASLEERVSLLRRAVKSSPLWVTPRQQLAQVLLELGNIKEAEDEIDTAISQLISAASQDSAPTERDSLTEYFESAVTGRTWPTALEELRDLQQKSELKE